MNIKLHQNKVFDIMVVAIDILLVLLSSVLVQKVLSLYMDEAAIKSISDSIVVATVSYVVSVIFMLDTYEFYTKTIRSKFEKLLSVAITVFISTIFTIMLQFAFINMFDKTVSIVFYLLMAAILFLLIGSFKMILTYVERKIEDAAKLLIIETKDVENSLARKIKYSYLALYESWYLLIDVNNQDEIDELINVTFKEYESIFISPDIPDKLRNLLISKAVEQNKIIYILPDFYNISVMKNEAVQFDDTLALRIKPYGLTKMQRAKKRAVDIIVALVGIIITLPVYFIVPIAIKLESRGPAIFKQRRVTINQKVFNMYKFRTMYKDAEKDTGAVLATENDPRITKVGRFLRYTRIDELPQLFNVLFGDMTIVGPRPERPVFVEKYLKEIENYDKRFFVKAGLTGLAQVYARYDTTTKDKILYDLLYIKDYSFFKDIKIILMTIKIMFVKQSAEGVREINYQQQGAASNPKRVLVVAGRMHYGGLETMIMNFFRLVDRSKVVFDFMLNYEEKGVFDDEITAMGGKIFIMPRLKFRNTFKYIKEVNAFFKKHKGEYEIVHGHLTSVGFIYLLLAKLHGVKTTIIHGHYTRTDPTFKGWIERLILLPLRHCADYYFACSNMAGVFCYGKKKLKKDNYKLINNGIFIENFSYNTEVRERKREEMGLKDRFVILNIGRFEQQKNHTFLIDIFEKIYKRDNSALLLLVGNGSLMQKMQEKVERLGLSDAVRFLNVRDDVSELLQASDIFLLPSLYEGLPVVSIEAQASGIYCVMADTITTESDITGNCSFLSLKKSPDDWAEEVLKHKNYNREDTTDKIKAAGYDIHEQASWLQEFYLNH
ncbi:MAG: exopolysaccharide biosynthesis polyprenyl glycosylphosphotransferase [Monoglobales bacterium]